MRHAPARLADPGGVGMGRAWRHELAWIAAAPSRVLAAYARAVARLEYAPHRRCWLDRALTRRRTRVAERRAA